MGFTKSVADFKGFKGIKPKYLTTTGASGISKRYRLEKTAIAYFNRHAPFEYIQYHALLQLN